MFGSIGWGIFAYRDFQASGLPKKYWGIDGFEHHGSLNLLKGGIQHADKISTVSPTYAVEIRSSEHGQSLEESLRFRAADLVGILNGINQEIWNPLTDPEIPHPIDPNNPAAGKDYCKVNCQRIPYCTNRSPTFRSCFKAIRQKDWIYF